MYNSVEEKIRIINNLVKASISDGGDAGGAYFSCQEEVKEILNVWLEKEELKDNYKVITEEREFEHCKDLFDICPKIVPMDYNIMHPELDAKLEGWDF